MSAGRPRSEFCHRGHALSGDNLLLRMERYKHGMREVRRCWTCLKAARLRCKVRVTGSFPEDKRIAQPREHKIYKPAYRVSTLRDRLGYYG